MAWSFVNLGALGNANNAASVTAGLPASTISNDLLVILAYSRDGSVRTPDLPAGWSEGARFDGGSTNGEIALFYKVHDGSEANTAVAFSGAGSSGVTEMVRMMAFRGNAISSPLGDVGADSSWSAAQNIGPITAVTLTTAGQLLLVCAARQNDMNANTAGNSANVDVLSGDSQSWVEAMEWGATLGTDGGMVVDYAFTSGTPSITDKTFTNNNTTTAAGCGFMVAFKPLITQLGSGPKIMIAKQAV